MPLPSSGTIAISQISVELGRASTATTSLGETASRNLAGVPSGTISMSNFYGKSNTFAFTISSNQDRANLRSLAVAAGWNQSSNVQATLAGGVWIYSATTATPALTIDGSWPGGVTLINNGNIVGMGGNGGVGSGYAPGTVPGGSGGGGGTAIACSVAVTIQNNSNVAGGGGGGGGGGYSGTSGQYGVIYAAGGGGGGGRTGLTNSSGGGGAGGINGIPSSASSAGGAGTSGGAGGGGAAGTNPNPPSQGGVGGAGGGWGAAGAVGGTAPLLPIASSGAGGAAGFCATGSGNITWSATGNRFGPFG